MGEGAPRDFQRNTRVELEPRSFSSQNCFHYTPNIYGKSRLSTRPPQTHTHSLWGCTLRMLAC